MDIEAINNMRNLRAAKPMTVQSQKDAAQAQIEADIEAFTKAGGEITVLESVGNQMVSMTYKQMNDSTHPNNLS